MNEDNIITAANADAKQEILKCAMYSYCGRIIYRKWDRKQRRYVKRSHVVVPIDCGVTSKGNQVLYAEDVEQNMQVKQFIIKQILSFENLREKRKTAFPIQLNNIKRMFGVFKVREDYDMAAGAKTERNLVAKELRRIAQEIYEFSGCEGNLYSDSKKKDPYSYNVIGDDGRDAAARVSSRVVAYLTDSQKRLVEQFEKGREKGLSFGDYFKWDSKGRCYFPLKSGGSAQDISKIDDESTKRIYELISNEGFVCPDYTSGYCYKKEDTGFTSKNPPKVLTVVKKALRNKANLRDGEDGNELYKVLSKSFNERSSGTMKHKGQLKLMMCVTCNAEDVAGMSSDRDWTSCVRLPLDLSEVREKDIEQVATTKSGPEIFMHLNGLFGREKMTSEELAEKYGMDAMDIEMECEEIEWALKGGGEQYDSALLQVKHGGMVAYLIGEDDKDIARPFARIAIKRLNNKDGGFVFEPEKKVYGDAYLADSCGFLNQLWSELKRSNATTAKGDSMYKRNDGRSFSDSHIYTRDEDINVATLSKADWRDIYDLLDKPKDEVEKLGIKLSEDDIGRVVDAHRFPPPKGMFDLFEKYLGHPFSDEFIEKRKGIMDADKYLFERGEKPKTSKPYEGDDAPRDRETMSRWAWAFMDSAKYGDEYGEMDEDGKTPLFTGGMNPVDAILRHYDKLPSALKELAMKSIYEKLFDYYTENAVELDEGFGYKTYAEFKEGFNSWSLDDDLQTEVYETMRENYEDEEALMPLLYHISVGVVDEADGERDKGSVFKLRGRLYYEFGGKEFDYYENTTVVNTEDAGWKTKMRDYCEDLFDQIPQFFG